ncbi:MAG: protein kinase [Candidatus Koribacter versatilis]|uniref:non-specific serine/threonine protein kinase n=1 Tax=Candidatus Korobacter versatilis TaxID=658062 RepID=A0A932EPH5_9BACT|nr:protein kinase [Candidatus Koribacter versatilis]
MKYCDACNTTYPNEFQTCPKDQTVLRTMSELRSGMVIRDKYQILEKIGAGGMAVVYLAKHLAFNELRAIKVVNSRLLDDENFLRRFRSEAIITRKLQHPNAVRVDDLDSTEDGRPFMVMEYVHGKDLRHMIQNSGPLPVRRALGIARQAAAALAAAHALGITHRDIKPDNILMTDTGDSTDLVKVLDFGIAKVREAGLESAHSSTKTGMVVGTPQYISPEQAMGRHGEEIDGRADLYSLGVVLYEMVTGRLPFESDTPMGMLLHHIQSIPPRAHEISPELRIPQTLSVMLVHALEKDRNLRYQNAAEFIAALDDVEQELRTGVTGVVTRPGMSSPGSAAAARARSAPAPAPARAPARPQPASYSARQAPPPARSSNWVIYVVAAVVLAGAVAGVYFWVLKPANSSAQANENHSTLLVPDDRLAADVRTALGNSSEIKSAIEVSASDGVVTLRGKVTGLYEMQMAESLTKSVLGIKDVKNELQYEKLSPVVDVNGGGKTPAQEAPGRQKPAVEKPRGPSTADKARSRTLVSQGNTQLDQGEYNAAIASYQQALDLDPDNGQAQSGLARAQKAKATEDEIMRRR